jgi:hypothetical protein
MWSIVQTGTNYDPFLQYVHLVGDVTDGLFAWIQIGVNTSASYIDDEYYSVAAYLDAEGGHANANANANANSMTGDGDMGGHMAGNGPARTKTAA